MDDDRQTRLLRRMDVTAKTVPLPRPVALVVMIIEPGLADADDARVRGARHQLRRIDIGMMVSVVRVDADARPDVAVRLGRGEHRAPFALARREVEHRRPTERTENGRAPCGEGGCATG